MNTVKSPSLLIIGADGLDPTLLQRFVAEGALPNLHALIREGRFSPLLSTLPPTTFPAWTSFATGTEPSFHGVTDFTIRRGYRVTFTGAHHRTGTAWFEHFESLGLSTGVAWFPASYPPVPLSGFHISGWDSPVDTRGDASFVYPPQLHDALQRQFGDAHLRFDAIDEFRDDEDWYANAARALPERIRERCDTALWLLKHRPVDVAAFYFGETDTACHHFWALSDPDSPRRPETVPPGLRDAISRVYAALDHAIGRLVNSVGPETNIVILSDHGSGGNSDHVVHLNRLLEQAGLLRFKPRSILSLKTGTLRGELVRHVPRTLRRRLFKLFGGAAPDLVESHIRFGAIDFDHTAAFSEELPYAPSIWFNQLGREPNGTIRASQRNAIARRIEDAAEGLRFSDGTNAIKAIHRREDLHDGPFATRFPDLVIEFNLLNGYSPVCAGSEGVAGLAVTVLDTTQRLGRKGRSLPGGHLREGVLIFKGALKDNTFPLWPEDVRPHIHEVTALLCALLGVPAAPGFSRYRNGSGTAPAFPVSPADKPAYTAAQEKVVAARLARLGYLED